MDIVPVFNQVRIYLSKRNHAEGKRRMYREQEDAKEMESKLKTVMVKKETGEGGGG